MSSYLAEQTTAEQYLIDLRIQLEFIVQVINDNPQDINKPVTFGDLREHLEGIIADLP
jgi:hypothetical protein